MSFDADLNAPELEWWKPRPKPDEQPVCSVNTSICKRCDRKFEVPVSWRGTNPPRLCGDCFEKRRDQ